MPQELITGHVRLCSEPSHQAGQEGRRLLPLEMCRETC